MKRKTFKRRLVQQREQESLEPRIESLAQRFDAVLEDIGVRYWQRSERQRLLIWLQWARRDRIPVETVMLRVTVRYRSLNKWRQGRTATGGLGISLATLTGQKAEQWFRDWMERRKVRQTVAGRWQWKSRMAGLDEYRDQALKHRQKIRAEQEAQAEGRRKAYRGGPNWVGFDAVRDWEEKGGAGSSRWDAGDAVCQLMEELDRMGRRDKWPVK